MVKFIRKQKAIIGLNKHERTRKQTVIIYGQISGQVKKPLKKVVIYYIKNYLKYDKPRLIEKALYDLAVKITTNHNEITDLTINFKKPNALREARAVGIGLTVSRFINEN